MIHDRDHVFMRLAHIVYQYIMVILHFFFL